MKTLRQYLYDNRLTNAGYARIIGVTKMTVGNWVRRGVIVVDGKLYAPVKKCEGGEK